MTVDPLRDPDVVERIMRRALADGDVVGVEAALRVMVTLDPHRAELLHGELRLALRMARRVRARET